MIIMSSLDGAGTGRQGATPRQHGTLGHFGQVRPDRPVYQNGNGAAQGALKVTLYQFAFIAFKIENRLLFPGGEKEQRGETHGERSLAEMIELKGLVEAPHGAITGVDIISTQLYAHPLQPPPNC
ncbi:hypothetical protein FOA52_014044 [Chlamydomonas sp. UWO 241]|nr:hypothetical protein FOA52_014044 [Chlamydomonas sp. UWO 241]